MSRGWVCPPILRDNSIGTWMFRLYFRLCQDGKIGESLSSIPTWMDEWRWVMKCPEEQLWICWSTICLVRHEVTFFLKGPRIRSYQPWFWRGLLCLYNKWQSFSSPIFWNNIISSRTSPAPCWVIDMWSCLLCWCWNPPPSDSPSTDVNCRYTVDSWSNHLHGVTVL